MTNVKTMPEISCFLSARRHLREGRAVRALLIIGDLLQSEFGRPLAYQLLAEMYPASARVGEGTSANSLPAGRTVRVYEAGEVTEV